MRKGTAQNDVNIKDISATSEVDRLLGLDKVPWYQKKNLKSLYLCLVPAALGVEMTTGEWRQPPCTGIGHS